MERTKDYVGCFFFESDQKCHQCSKLFTKDSIILYELWHNHLTRLDIEGITDQTRRLYNRRTSYSEDSSDGSSKSGSPSLISPSSSPPSSGSKLSYNAAEFVPSSKGLTHLKSFDDFLQGAAEIASKRERGLLQSRSKLSYHEEFRRHFNELAARMPNIQGNRKFRPRSTSERRLHRHCSFCIRRGMDEAMCSSHCLRNPVTNSLVCPLIKNELCKLCGDGGGDDVHVQSECPKLLAEE